MAAANLPVGTVGPASYRELFDSAALDPHGGEYLRLMHVFRTEDGAPLPDALRNQVGQADESQVLGFAGLFRHPTDECGRVRLLQAVSKFPSQLGHPTSWDGAMFAFWGDVEAGQATTVDFPPEAFEWHLPAGVHENAPRTINRAREILDLNPQAELIGPFEDAEANIQQIRTRLMVPVPHRYANLLLGRDLTPRQAFLTLTDALEAHNDTTNCTELVNWLLLALTREDVRDPPALLQDGLSAPVADAALHRHRKSVLDLHLTGLASGTPQQGSNQAHLAASVHDIVTEQRLARSEAEARAEKAKEPKSPRAHFGRITCGTLVALCQVNDEASLPEVWHRLAEAGKKDRLALEQAVLDQARRGGMAEQAPVITPDLAKKVTQLQWAGMDMDELSEGIQPFSITLPDYATASHGREAQQRADAYDLLTSSDTSSTLSDAKALKSSSAVIPSDYLDARAHLTGLMILWGVLVGDGHPFVLALGNFIRSYTNREQFYRNRLMLLPRNGPAPALLLRYVQLRTVNYWREALAYQHLPPQPPAFDEVLHKLAYSDHSWVPSLPERYWKQSLPSMAKGPSRPSGSAGSSSASTVSGLTGSTQSTQPSTDGSAAGPVDNPSARAASRITNAHVSAELAAFQDAAGKVRVVEAVAKAGPTPSVQRDGKDVAICISYHVRGNCWRGCPRAADHGPHSEAEAQALLTWCQAAYNRRLEASSPQTPKLTVETQNRPSSTPPPVLHRPPDLSAALPSPRLPGDFSPVDAHLSDELGKSIREHLHAFHAADSWESFLHAVRGPPDLSPEVKHIQHPASQLLNHLRAHGAPVATTTEPWTLSRLDDAVARGPHHSAKEHRSFVREEFADFLDKRFWTVLPYSTVRSVPGLRLSPLGVVPQRDRRPRLIVDLSFRDVNQETVPLAPAEAMQFGRTLQRILQRILDADPRYGPVRIAKIDLADGFYRIQIAPRDVAKLGVILPTSDGEEPLVAFPLVLPMGWVASPPYFCAATETAADLMNAALRAPSLDALHLPPHRLEDAALTHPSSDSTATPEPASHVHRPRLRRPLRAADVYVDDFIALMQGDSHAQRLTMRALLTTLDIVFRPLAAGDLPKRQEPASLKKLLKADAAWSTAKVVLGWLLDTASATIQLPPHRRDRLLALLDSVPPTAKRAGVKTWRRLLGELRSMMLAIPGSRGLFSTLQHALKYDGSGKPNRVRLTAAVHQFLADFRALASSLAARPTRIAEVLPQRPSIIGTTDASGAGMGGVAFVHQPDGTVEPLLWRAQFPPHIVRRLVSWSNPGGSVSNSDLELAASVVHHGLLADHFDLREHTIHTCHDNTPATYWQRKGSASTSGPAAYLLRLQAFQQRNARFVTRHDYLPGPLNTMADECSRLCSLCLFLSPAAALAPADSTARAAFIRDLGLSQAAVRAGVVPGTQQRADRHWGLWTEFCESLGIDPMLQTCADPLPYLQVFATRYRQRPGPTGLPVRSATVADAVRSVGQTMARLGASDKRLDTTGNLDFRLSRQFRAYGRLDPPPHRVKPIPIVIVRQALDTARDGSASARAVADMIVVAFFFLLRPGEYTGANNDDTPFRLADVQLFSGQRRLDLLAAPDVDLLAATGASLTFTSQKNGVRGEVVTHGTSGHHWLCPVRAIARRVLHLRAHSATPQTELASYFDGRHRMVTGTALTAALRAAALLHGPAYGFAPGDVSARSLRAGGAMALFNSQVDSDTIRLLGRWQSDAMLRYLHLQAQPVMRGFAQRMLQGGDYRFHPNQALPDLVPLY